jgi:hypothetical protein
MNCEQQGLESGQIVMGWGMKEMDCEQVEVERQ